jgi:hypothetical protein
MTIKPTYNAKPMTLYVKRDGIADVTPEHFGIETDRIIDIELTELDAKNLLALLKNKLSTEVYGTVTFRLIGRLIL